MKKTALITGITGQDGSYLATLLINKGYNVVGLRKKNYRTENISYLPDSVEYIQGDLNDIESIHAAVTDIKPDEIYNLASQSYPGESWKRAVETGMINSIGAHNLFEAVKTYMPTCKVCQASSSEMYGEITQSPQNEGTPFKPLNPYAASKVYAHNMAKIYRKSYQLFISCGILFNHESPRRGMHFITQKVCYGAACIKMGIKTSSKRNEKGEPIVKDGKLSLGNLTGKKDWGYAADYVEAMWLMLQQSEPDDFVIGTGRLKTIEDLCESAFTYAGLNWKDHIIVDTQLARPTETGPAQADATKAKKVLGWEPKKSFEDIIAEIVEFHLMNIKHGTNAL